MTLTNDQLRLIDSCPALAGLKDWIIAVDSSVNSTTTTPSTGDNSQEPAAEDPQEPTDNNPQEPADEGTG